jgi:hypothetical protein
VPSSACLHVVTSDGERSSSHTGLEVDLSSPAKLGAAKRKMGKYVFCQVILISVLTHMYCPVSHESVNAPTGKSTVPMAELVTGNISFVHFKLRSAF